MTYAICKADLLLKGEGDAADNIVGGPEHSTLSNDAFRLREFDFMLSNPHTAKAGRRIWNEWAARRTCGILVSSSNMPVIPSIHWLPVQATGRCSSSPTSFPK